MITRKLQGRVPTLRDQQRARMIAHRTVSVTSDFELFRENFNSRLFVGPPTPLHLMRQMQPTVIEDRVERRYWQMAADFARFGYCEFNQRGTPFAGDAFGF